MDGIPGRIPKAISCAGVVQWGRIELSMSDVSKFDISGMLRDTPILIFLFFGIVLTQSSMLFPQNLGRFQTVSGWPLTMYKAQYREVGDIDSTGRIIRRVVPQDPELMVNRILTNILLWTLLLYGTWWIVEKSSLLRRRTQV